MKPVLTSWRLVYSPVLTSWRLVYPPVLTSWRLVYPPGLTSWRLVYPPGLINKSSKTEVPRFWLDKALSHVLKCTMN